MKFSEILPLFLNQVPEEQRRGTPMMRRTSEPHIVYELDGAEGGTIWHMNDDDDDDCYSGASFDLIDIAADDWEMVD